MKNRYAMVILAITLTLCASCATVGGLTPGRDSFDLGLTLFNQGRFDAAIPYFEDATHENPNLAQAYLYLGRAYISQSRWRAAIQPLRTAFRLSPRESQQEIMNLLVDAMFAAALNDFNLGAGSAAPLLPKEIL
jgi:tetratricopeptide (TPR) repeat protein